MTVILFFISLKLEAVTAQVIILVKNLIDWEQIDFPGWNVKKLEMRKSRIETGYFFNKFELMSFFSKIFRENGLKKR